MSTWKAYMRRHWFLASLCGVESSLRSHSKATELHPSRKERSHPESESKSGDTCRMVCILKDGSFFFFFSSLLTSKFRRADDEQP